MSLFRAEERRAIESLARLADCNPFSPAFVEGERTILGPDHTPAGAVWSLRTEPGAESSALAKVGIVAERMARDARERLLRRRDTTVDELRLYASAVIYTVYLRYADPLHELHLDPERARRRVTWYRSFRRDLDHFFPDRLPPQQRIEPAHLFACFYQVRRAFHLIHRHIVGGVRAGGPLARRGLAVDLHPRHAAVLALSLRPHARRHHVDHGPVRNRQGTRRPGDRPVALHPLRPGSGRPSPRPSTGRSTR